MTKKLFPALWLCFLSIQTLFAQYQLGLTTSGFGGTHLVYANPAFLANPRHHVYVNLASAQFGATNNYVRYEGGLKFGNISDISFDKDKLTYDNSGKTKFLSTGFDIRLPSVLVAMSPKHSIALTSRARLLVQGRNFNQEFAQIIVEGIDLDKFQNKPFENYSFNAGAYGFSELALSYARVIKDDEKSSLKAGITFKKLNGYAAAYVNAQDFSFQLNTEPDPNLPIEEQTVANIKNISLQYGYVDPSVIGNLTPAQVIFGNGLPGSGIGFDFGASYEKKAENSRYPMDYQYRIGFALMDIGGVRFKSSSAIQAYNITRTNKKLVLDDFDDIDTDDDDDYAEQVQSVINNALDITPNEKKDNLKFGLPTTMNVNFDYRIYKKVYVNAFWIQGLRSQKSTAAYPLSVFSVTPRVQMKWLEVALPVSLVNNYKNLAVGAMARLGFLYVGTDNLAGALGGGSIYGTDFYFGLNIPVFQRKREGRSDESTEEIESSK
ncbi:MAG: hypothetical protein H7Y04_01665 [Verrucomicrobia bacterium]|nr:hypothetical protein [Cytophagales bacterium]